MQGLSSGDRMDFTLQKAVELGVGAIQPVATERSVVKLKEERAQRPGGTLAEPGDFGLRAMRAQSGAGCRASAGLADGWAAQLVQPRPKGKRA